MKLLSLLCVLFLSVNILKPFAVTEYFDPYQARKSPIDFFKKGVGQIKGNSFDGVLKFDVDFNFNGNTFGRGTGFMIYKRGAMQWVSIANKKFPLISKIDGINYGYEVAAKRLLKEDKILLNDFNCWVFFVEREYLEKAYESDESGKSVAFFSERKNSLISVSLYQRLEGEKDWLEIDKYKYLTDKYGASPRYDKWKMNWIEKLVNSYSISNRDK
jgi:hypothetical protein